jgi:hypothetical protein
MEKKLNKLSTAIVALLLGIVIITGSGYFEPSAISNVIEKYSNSNRVMIKPPLLQVVQLNPAKMMSKATKMIDPIPRSLTIGLKLVPVNKRCMFMIMTL